MNLGTWLRNLGLERYEAAFRENEVDETVLASLTPEDLKDLGVDVVGHRRRLLDAIQRLHIEAHAESAATSSRTSVAERRQVTVVFSDLVGSTALSTRMDPEDLREVISAYRNCAAAIVHSHGGFIARYLGDGVLIYFGYPHAHEDNAERAVRAALELIAAVAAIQTSTQLQSRVGIATGLVVIGDLIESGEGNERGIVGETPNLAARLQSIAEPNTVVIADDTRRLVGNLFDFDDLGATELKGIAVPVRAWRVLRARSVESRFEAFHAMGVTALVGRDEELEFLQRRWSRAKVGEGQVVLLSGEVGIGKSRLTAALLEAVADEPHARARYFCSPQHTDSPLHPIIGQLERAIGLTREDSPVAKLDKLDAALTRTATSKLDAALIAEMLSLPNDGRYPTADLNPQQRRQRTMDALITQVQTLARERALLTIFDDAHWIDPTSLEVLGRVVDRVSKLRVLLIVAFRPEFEPPWVGLPHVSTLMLNRLTPRDSGTLIDRVVGNKCIPAGIRHDIIERTDGIPLFIEEMTKAVLEAGTGGAAEQTVAAAPSPAVAVPPSLHASLMARLDRLGSAKEIAQIGAAIGREFSYALIAAVVRNPEAKLDTALNRLAGSGLLFCQGTPPQASYLFKHALVQDAAYGTLLRGPRRVLHARIAEVIESDFPDIVQRQPELLARHCTDAGLIEKAAGLWGKAGQRSLARSALVEAAEQLMRALNQIATLPATPTLRREQINLQVAIITPLIHLKGHAAPETKAATERAHLLIEQANALGERLEDPLLFFSVLYGFWVANYVAFDGDAICDLAGRFLAMAENQGPIAALMVGHRLMAQSLLHTGKLAEGLVHYDRALAFYSPAEHRSLATRFGQDQRVAALCFRSLALWLLGYPTASSADATEALNDAREFGQAASLMVALGIAGTTNILCRNYAVARAQADELVPLANEKDAALWRALGMMNLGSVMALTGEAEEAIQALTSGIKALRSTGGTLFLPLFLTCLANANSDLGHFDEASRHISEAITAIGTTKELWFEAETYRIAGKIALVSRNPDKARAQANFERALAVARRQKARSWELRAATSLVRLWLDQGNRREARALLAPIYSWFTEGFDTLDLREAKALLENLE